MLNKFSCGTSNFHLPRVHPAVNHRIIHGVAHRQPVYGQIRLLNVRRIRYVGKVVRDDEVQVERKPANGEYYNDHHHHLDDLRNNSGDKTSGKKCETEKKRVHVMKYVTESSLRVENERSSYIKGLKLCTELG